MEFSGGLDFSAFMLNILTVMDNHNTLRDKIWQYFVGLYFNFVRYHFSARTTFSLCCCPVELVSEGTFCFIMVC